MKYKLTNETLVTQTGETLFRIEALHNIYGNYLVRKGQRGGFVESRQNLADDGKCWIADDACVYGEARVIDDALVLNHASVSGTSVIKDEARISGHATVHSSKMEELAHVLGHAEVALSNLSGEVLVQGNVNCQHSNISGRANLKDNVRLYASGVMGDGVVIMGHASIVSSRVGDVEILTNVVVIGGHARIIHAKVYGKNVVISEYAHLGKGVMTLGENIKIQGQASITGKVEILSNVVVQECVSIENVRHVPFLLDNETISGDVVINM